MRVRVGVRARARVWVRVKVKARVTDWLSDCTNPLCASLVCRSTWKDGSAASFPSHLYW